MPAATPPRPRRAPPASTTAAAAAPQGHIGSQTPCYEYEGVPAEEQLSTIPEPSASGVLYHPGYNQMDQNLSASDFFEHPMHARWRCARPAARVAAAPRGGERSSPESAARRGGRPDRYGGSITPLERCPGNCSFDGQCLKGTQCLCVYGRTGNECEHSNSDACFNDCSKHGRCIRGYCSCEWGWFGIDCSIDLSLLGGCAAAVAAPLRGPRTRRHR